MVESRFGILIGSMSNLISTGEFDADSGAMLRNAEEAATAGIYGSKRRAGEAYYAAARAAEIKPPQPGDELVAFPDES